MEQMLRQAERLDDGGIVFAGLGGDHAAGGGVGVLVSFHAAELPEQILRHHQKVRHAVQPAGLLVRIELINGVEGLELDAGLPIQAGKADLLMYLRDHRFCTAVPVGVAGEELLVAPEQHIVHAPGVDGQAFDRPEALPRFSDAGLHMSGQRLDIPGQMAVQLGYAVWKAIDFFGFQFSVFRPAYDVAAGGGADVDGKIAFQKNHPPVLFPMIQEERVILQVLTFPKKCPYLQSLYFFGDRP